MKTPQRLAFLLPILGLATTAFAGNNPNDPTWWDKYAYLVKNGADTATGSSSSISYGKNVDISNECGPQSETFITLNPSAPKQLAAGSNEIFRLPMRGYYSNGGNSWGGVDLPLPQIGRASCRERVKTSVLR